MVSLRLVLSGLNFKKIVPIIKNQAVNLQTNDLMKSQRAYQILVVSVLIFPATIFSQQQMPPFAQKTPHVFNTPGNFKVKEHQDNNYATGVFSSHGALRPLAANSFPLRIEVLSANSAIQGLPFFCKKEFLFEKNTSIPLRMRLGSLDYVNKLEGKENHWSVAPAN
jgi:hypothetical protein